VSIDLTEAIEAAATEHARIQYRHAGALDALTDRDWIAMRAFVTPLVTAAADVLDTRIREQVASDIEGACYPHKAKSAVDVDCPACSKAASIARGAS
jgi:hypothetical protein